jgi:HlyD family type I secretion membrane fusion protein
MSEEQKTPTEKFVGYDPVRTGVISLLVFFTVFFIWAIVAPIQSASIADGTIVLDFNHKTVQHLEGGIIDSIAVKDGQVVTKGDILLTLHDVKVKSEQDAAKSKLWTMLIQRDRLLAEKNGQDFNVDKFLQKLTTFPADSQADLKAALNNQVSIYNTNKDKKAGELKVLNDKVISNTALARASENRLSILRKELNSIRPLVKANNLPAAAEYDLQKQISELTGTATQSKSEAESAQKQIENFKNEELSKIFKSTEETETEIVNLSNQLTNTKDVLRRSEILAPTDGKIMNMKYHTIGAVVPPGGEIMDIVPQNDVLIIEAKIKPQDIDEVRTGLKAKIALSAYKGKKVPKLDGEVVNLSADIVVDDRTRESYFLARVKIVDENINKLREKVELYPGMPAQVFIITGSRSLMTYLFTPIEDAAYKAFRES